MYNTNEMSMMDHGHMDMEGPLPRQFFDSPHYEVNSYCHHHHHRREHNSEENSSSIDLMDDEGDDEMEDEDCDLLDDSRSPLSSSALSDQENSVRGSRRRRRRCPQQQIQQRQAANMRERKRMQSINDAFESLRAHIPIEPYDKRMSKVDTLKMAINYIEIMSQLIKMDKNGNEPRGPPPPPPKKIVIQAHRGGEFGLIGGHSLSWMSEKGGRCGSIMIAKVWTPENPNNGRTLVNGSGGGTPFRDEN